MPNLFKLIFLFRQWTSLLQARRFFRLILLRDLPVLWLSTQKTKSASGYCDLASPKTCGVHVVLGKRLRGEGLSTLKRWVTVMKARNKPKKLQYNRQMQQTHCTVSYCYSTENCTGSAAATANLDTFTNEGEAFFTHEYIITRQGRTFLSILHNLYTYPRAKAHSSLMRQKCVTPADNTLKQDTAQQWKQYGDSFCVSAPHLCHCFTVCVCCNPRILFRILLGNKKN